MGFPLCISHRLSVYGHLDLWNVLWLHVCQKWHELIFKLRARFLPHVIKQLNRHELNVICIITLRRVFIHSDRENTKSETKWKLQKVCYTMLHGGKKLYFVPSSHSNDAERDSNIEYDWEQNEKKKNK